MTSRDQSRTLVLALVVLFGIPGLSYAQSQEPGGGHAPAVPSAPPTATPPVFADDVLTYVFGTTFRNPFVASASQPDGADIGRQAIEFRHVDAWKYGHNTVEIQIKKSNDAEPASGGGSGALGLYGIFRSGVGINRLAGRPLLAWGPLRDIDLQVGLNIETKNSAYGPEERSLYVGPNLQFRVGAGFVNLGFQLRKEWNHNGSIGKSEVYDLNVNIEPVWHLPFRVGRVQMAFDGFADYNTAKGKDAAGRDTAPEFITRPQLKVDVGSLAGGRSRVIELGVGVEYWHDMFGKNADRVPGAKQVAPVVTLAVHLPLAAGRH